MPNSDLISRAALGISRCNPDVFNDRAYGEGWNACIAMIEAAPVVDAAPVVHGRWEEKNEHIGLVCCSVCHDCYVEKEWIFNMKWAWCPQCGARMDGGDNNG